MVVCIINRMTSPPEDPTLFTWLFSFKEKLTSQGADSDGNSTKIPLTTWQVFGLLTLLVFSVYANSLGNGFVSDDKGLLDIGARQISLSYIFSDPFSFIHSIIFAISYLFFGTNAVVLRLINIFFHLGNCFLIYLIIKKLFNSRAALFTSAIFAVHPILTEAVSWISGGVYSQYTFFFLLSFLFYLLFSENKSQKYYYLSIGIYLLGLLDSNRVLALAPIYLVYEYSWGDLKKNWRLLTPFFGLSIFWGLVYFFQIGLRTVNLPQITYSSSGLYNPLLQIPYAIWTYLKLIFWPDKLSFYQSDYLPSMGMAAFRVIIVVFYLIITGYFYVKNKKLFFLLALFLISLTITLTPLKIASPVAERYSYLGSLGLIAFVCYLFDKVATEKNLQLGIYISILLIVFLLGARTIVRNLDWKNTDTLALATVRSTPSSPRAHNLVGAYYFRIGDHQKAAQEFQTVIKLNPNFADAYHNLAVIYSGAGKYDEAVQLDLKAISLNKSLPQAYVSLTDSYLKKGDKENAKKIFAFLKEAAPNNPVVKELEKKLQ